MQRNEAAPAATATVTSGSRNNYRRRRNRKLYENLAIMDREERKFSGNIDKLPVIGQPHGVTFEKLIEEVHHYMVLNFKGGYDLLLLLEEQIDDFEKASGMSMPTISEKDMERKDKWYKFESQIGMYLNRKDLYEDNKTKLYVILYGQCTPKLRTTIEFQPNYTEHNSKSDVVWLMKVIKNLSTGIDENDDKLVTGHDESRTANRLVTAHDALRKFYMMYQRPRETNADYMERFNELWNTAEAAAGKKCLVPDIIKSSAKYANMNEEEWIEATKAIYFLLHSDRNRYGEKLNEMSLALVLGRDDCPTTLNQAYRILSYTKLR